MKGKVYFISGIDTDAGKTICTAILAKEMREKGINSITQKFIQTGNKDVSEDILMHRYIMGIPMEKADIEKLTMPEIFSYPCSPHLAAKIDNREVDIDKINLATEKLQEIYDVVLVEGAGGIMVPIREDYLTIDYINDMNYPLIFVTSGKLGSLNHTLLSLEAIKSRHIQLDTVVFNRYMTNNDELILNDSIEYIKKYLNRHFPNTKFIEIDSININCKEI